MLYEGHCWENEMLYNRERIITQNFEKTEFLRGYTRYKVSTPHFTRNIQINAALR